MRKNAYLAFRASKQMVAALDSLARGRKRSLVIRLLLQEGLKKRGLWPPREIDEDEICDTLELCD